jgi:hypothetical protein
MRNVVRHQLETTLGEPEVFDAILRQCQADLSLVPTKSSHATLEAA